eukprot:TRINITY_DN81209_c0_g1_i1.p1 TRINITY_DN81209_c0_g1~~TRINITY_DN81209_c0_g1_i1.p1  ORF type:complete len:440 (+),score=94.55 TRINITY_DN81209_c0_g1_i1:49-1320(+)
MSAGGMYPFFNVAIGLPAGGSAAYADFQDRQWIPWCNGDLRIDAASSALLFTPHGSPSAKNLGCMQGAKPIATEAGRGSWLIMTNDQAHGQLRLTFTATEDDKQFMHLVQAAEKARTSVSSSGGGRVSRSLWEPPANGMMLDELTARLTEISGGVAPLLLSGVEMYGPDPYQNEPEAEASHVLLGRGSLAFLDPCEVDKVGKYELLFFEAEALEPMLRVQIGPRMKLVQQPFQVAERLSIAPRASGATAGLAAVFDLLISGEPARQFGFDDEAEAAAFRRDFVVRQRLVALSLRTSRFSQATEMMESEFERMKANGLFPTLQRWFLQLLMLFVVAIAVHSFLLYYYAGASVGSAVQESLQSAQAQFSAAAGSLSQASASVCQAVSQAVPVAAVDRCASLPLEVGEGAVRTCLAKLVDMAGGAS